MAEMAESGVRRRTSGSPPAKPRGAALAVRTDDWPAQATDTIVRAVGSVRDKTTGPALTIARAVVYGLLAAIVGSAAVVLLTIMAVRFVNIWLPGDVWAAYLLLGSVFSLGGVLLMVLSRRPRARDDD